MSVSDIAVVVGGAALVGFSWWFFFGPKRARSASVVGGVQEVAVTVKGGYSPDLIRVTEGVPLRLVFDRQEAGDCTSRVVFGDFGVSKSLPAFGTATLEFTPDRVGRFDFTCGMNMIHGTLVVEPADGSGDHQPDGDGTSVAEAVGVGPSIEPDAGLHTERAEFRITDASCASCVVHIESILDDVAGVDRSRRELRFGTGHRRLRPDPYQPRRAGRSCCGRRLPAHPQILDGRSDGRA